MAVNATILLMPISGQLRIGVSSSSCISIVTSDWTVVVRKKKDNNDDKNRQPRSKRKEERERERERERELSLIHI